MRPPKKITKRTLVGEQGVYLVGQIVMQMGYAWYPTGSVEAGIDGHIELRDAVTERVFNLVIGVQIKAVGGPFANETDTGLDFYCDERDLDYWLGGNLPVIFVVSRPSTNEAYWISVKDYFGDPSRRASRKAHFVKARDRFDAGCRNEIFHLAKPRNSGLYLSPLHACERLISSMLPVAFLPPLIYVGETDCRQPGQVWVEARRRGVNIGGEWILRNRRVVGFRDLSRPEWSTVCDQATVEDFATEEWSQTTDPDRRRDFVDLLQRTLREMIRDDLRYDDELELFHFRPTPDLSPREMGSRTVFKAYRADDGTVKYYRHSAFHDRFHRFDGQWILEITPTYYFSSDRYRLRPGYERFLKGIKKIEGHDAVRGQVTMWGAYLSPGADMFNTEPYPFLGFGDLVTFEANRGIDDKQWDAMRERFRTEKVTTSQSCGQGRLPT